METKQIFVDLLLNSLVTNSLTSLEVQELVSNEVLTERYSKEKLEAYYKIYRSRDLLVAKEIIADIQRVLESARKSEVLNLQRLQIEESYSVEEIVNSLYNVGMLLETRVNVVNQLIEDKTNLLEDFAMQLSKLNEQDHIFPIDNILNVLQNYKMILNKLEDF